MSDTSPLILIDGSSWLYRAFHALPPLTNSRGEPTGAIYGMASMLRRLFKDYAPQRIAVVFDPPGKTFRNDLYAEYKANRPPVPEDMATQFPVMRELLEALRLPVLQVDGVEADDVIGTLALQARARGWPVLIVTGDKDMAQLVDDQVRLLDTMKNRTLDAAAVQEKFGVPPERIVDYLALVGDSSDNIPGVPGVGPKTAAKWLAEHGTLDAVVANADAVTGKIGDKLRAALEQLPLARDLATIRTDVALPMALDALAPGEPDADTLAALYRRLEFNRWLDELQIGANATPAAPAEQAVHTEHETVLDENALQSLVEVLQQAELLCVDTETDSLDAMRAQLVGLSFAVEPGRAWYVPVAHRYLGAPRQLDRDKVLDALRGVLENPNKPKVGQHIKYDLNVLARHGVDVQGVAYDTMLESYVLDAAGSRHDMDTLALTYLDHRTIKFSDVAGKGRQQITFDQVDLEHAAPYAAEDADVTLRLHRVLYPRVCAVDALRHVFETIEMPLVPVLAAMERHGVRVNRRHLGTVSREFGDRMEQFQAQAWEAAGQEFNLASPPQLQQILFDKLGLPVKAKTPGGQPSTNEDALEQIAELHPLPHLILQWRQLSKLRSTYADTLVQRIHPQTGRIHTSYHQAVAATGRLSSSEPNLQNIPIRTDEGRRIREAFIAEDGHRLLAIDYSQIELRLMAHLSGDPRLQEAFACDQDIHRATAAEVFGLDPDAVDGDQRRAAKAINFGLIYGMSAFGLARQLSIGRDEAGAYIDTFFKRYPGVKRYMDSTREQAREQGYVETLFGRRLYLKDIRSKNPNLRQYAERTAINAPLQGTAADLIKLAMIDLHAWLAQHAPEVRMIMQVHDELVFEGPAQRIQTLAADIAGRMCRIHRLDVPLVADWGTGDDWNAAHEPQGHARSGG